MATTPLEQQIQTLAKDALAAHGLVLVSARLVGGARALTLEVLAENPDGTGASIDACTLASRTLAAQLDVEEVLNTRYILEVGSPGMDRPLFTTADYQRFTGKQAKLSLSRKIAVGDDQVTTVIGKITAADEKAITLDLGQHWPQPLKINLADIRSAHLHPSREEVDAVMKAANLRQNEEERAENPDRPRYDRKPAGGKAEWQPPAPRQKEVREKAHRPRIQRDEKPNFKRGDFLLNEKERAELGVLTDDEKSAAKIEKKRAYRKEQAEGKERTFAKRAWSDRKSGGPRPERTERRPGERKGAASSGERKSYGAKKSYGDKPAFGEKKFGDKKFGDKKPYGAKKPGGKTFGKSGGFGAKGGKPAGKPGGPRKSFNKSK